MTIDTEIQTLEECLAECQRRLDNARSEQMDLQVGLLEADLNNMLERLQILYEERKAVQA